MTRFLEVFENNMEREVILDFFFKVPALGFFQAPVSELIAPFWALAENGWPPQAVEPGLCCESQRKADDADQAVPRGPAALPLARWL